MSFLLIRKVFSQTANDTDIAIIGMAAHFPAAADTETYWNNLAAGGGLIRVLSEEVSLVAGETPSRLRDPN